MGVPNNQPAEPVYEDFRQLLALSEGRTSRNPGLLCRMKTGAKRSLEFLAGLLETRAAICVAALLCLALAGVSWLGIQKRTLPQPVIATAASDQSEIPPVFQEASPPITTAPLEEIYIVRVGSFRDPANATRIVESLRERTSNVRTEELGGLYVVELGPFPQRSDAEDSARELRRDGLLSPQIVRRK